MFKGSYVALVTPFKNGQIDREKLQSLVEWHLTEGTDGFVPVGTTGEGSTLSFEEHADVIEIVAKAVRKRVPVIAGAGSNSTEEAISLSLEAEKRGADGLLSVNPYYNRPTQEGLTAHFSAIADSVGLPIVLYNIPSRTGVCLTPETAVALAKSHKNIVGIKESTGSMDQATETLRLAPEHFSVISGDDSLTLPLMALGAKGVISVAANLAPGAVKELCQASLDGRTEDARRFHLKLFPLIKALFIETSPSPIKAAMLEAGLLQDDSVRLPLVQVRPETRKLIKAAMKEFGVKIPAQAK